jgi:hypothetical protein
VNGQLVCGKSGGTNSDSDEADDHDKSKKMNSDNDGSDDHDNSKKKNKHNDEDTGSDDGLTQCSIQESSGGGGCVVGFKHVCEKLKNGKKCCGCVPDKNAQAAQPRQFCCTAMIGTQVGPQFCEPTRAEAEREASFTRLNNQPPSSIPCIVECLVNGSFSHQPGACK